MKIWKTTLLLLALIVALPLLSCSDDDEISVTDPVSATGTTNAEGNLTLDLGAIMLTVNCENESGGNVGEMPVTAYLLQNYLAVFAAGNSTYYPSYNVISYDSLTAAEDNWYAPKPSATQGSGPFEAQVDVIMVDIDRDIYSYADEPEETEGAYSDPWITQHSMTGTLADVYNMADTINYQEGIFIHISDEVASLTNADVRTVSLPLSQIADQATFNVLVGLEFHIFDEDTLTINYITHQTNVWPVIYVDAITMVEGSFFAQFTLTWGENPGDLDSHLWTPDIEGSTYHIAYYSKGSLSTPPYVFLDVDDVTSWGPEHIVIDQGFAGTYSYAVHHFSGSSNISNSEAEVSILKPDRTVQKFMPPDGSPQSGWFWYVCDIDGTTGAVSSVNTYHADEPLTNLNASMMPAKSEINR